MMRTKGISGDAHFFEETLNMDRIQKLLDNKTGSAGISEKLEAMKSLLAMISKGEDVSVAFADVVKNVVVSSVEVKKLVYMYLVHYADADAQCRELALLSINSFQKDLADSNPLIRALALRVMTSIRVLDILQIQLIALRKCATDVSPYVRKCAANAINKLYVLDATQVDLLAEIISQLLNDTSTMVLGSAMQAFHDVCPDRIDLLHPCYRKICHVLSDLDEWGQSITLQVFRRYLRTQFTDPAMDESTTNKKILKKKKKGGFYSDEDVPTHVPAHGSVFTSAGAATTGGMHNEALDEDHRLLLRCSLPLLKSRNSAVVMTVATLHYYCGTHSAASSTLIGKSLVRIMRNQREIQYVVLSVIASMAVKRPQMFRPFLSDFFIQDKDPKYTRVLKLNILTCLAQDEESVLIILREFQAYVRHIDKSFVTATVHCLGRVADTVPSVAERCLKGLLQLVRSSNHEIVVAESVVVIRQLLQTNSKHECIGQVVRQLAAMLLTCTEEARASIVWILGEFRHLEPAKEYIKDALRILVRGFSEEESSVVKNQILNFTVKVTLNEPDLKDFLNYVLELCKYDIDYDLRDRGRFIQAIMESPETDVIKILASDKPTPLLTSACPTPRFTLGSLSNLVNHAVRGYSDLPPWAKTRSNPAKRDESSFTAPAPTSPPSHKVKKSKKPKTRKEKFYSSSEEEDASSSSSEGESSSEEEDDEEDSDDSSSEEETQAIPDIEVNDSSSSEEESDEESDEDEVPKYQNMDLLSGTTANDFLTDFGNINLKTNSSPMMPAHIPMSRAPAAVPILPPQQPEKPTLLSSNSTLKRYSLLTPGKHLHSALNIEFAYSREPSMYSLGMNLIQLWIRNQGAQPINRIRSVAKQYSNGQQIVPFPEIQQLPSGGSCTAQLHIDFAGRTSPLEFQIKSSGAVHEVSITPLIGELIRPSVVTDADFQLGIASVGGMNQHTLTVCSVYSTDPNIVRMVEESFAVAYVPNTTYCFKGQTRSEDEDVYINLQPTAREISIQVNCTNAILAPQLLTKLAELLKK